MTLLDLSQNKIGDVGANAIVEAVRAGGSLATLDLCSNNIGGAAKISLRNVVQGRQGFFLLV